MPGQKSVYSHDLRDDPEAPLCGTFRPSGPKVNTLLTKANLGCVKMTTYDLPSVTDFQHEYGLRQVRDGVTSSEVLGDWAQHEGTGNLQPPRDFKALNKKAAEAGCTDTKMIAKFRTTNDARLKLGTEKPKEYKPYDDSTTFGRSTTASESFWDLVSGQHRFEWVSTKPSAEEMVAAARPKKPGETKTSKLNRESALAKLADKEVKEPWKMQCFKNVAPKLGPNGL